MTEMIEVAQNQNPNLTLVCADIFKDDIFSDKFDVVYSSGIFNIDLGNNYEFLSNAILRFVSLTEKYVIFNLLADTSLDKESGYFYFNKSKVENILRTLSIVNQYTRPDKQPTNRFFNVNSYHYMETNDLGATGIGTMTLDGHDHIVDLNKHSGFEVANKNTTLNIKNSYLEYAYSTGNGSVVNATAGHTAA